MKVAESRALCDEFPSLYAADFTFCCGSGWVGLIRSLSGALVDHARGAGLRLWVTDVKEKHGGLRFYAEGTDDEAERLIAAAEAASLTIPEGGL